jgi:sortase A
MTIRSYTRPAAAILALAGMAVLTWVLVTMFWGEPFTAVTAARAQAALRRELSAVEETSSAQAASLPTLRQRAAVFRKGLHSGDAFGRIRVPRLNLSTVVVRGTGAAELARGPGHYRITAVPGVGGTVAIAGHRTTYLQPFRHIDSLERGDEIYLDMPYGTFRYAVYAVKIVDDRDWSILRRRSFEQLVLSACHPLHSAAQRIVVFARLTGVDSEL